MNSSAFRTYTKQIQKAYRLVRKQKSLRDQNLIPKRDLDFVYEIAFLSCFVALENYIEERFLSLLLGSSKSHSKSFSTKVPIASPLVAREFMYSGRSYIDYFPYENTERLAKRFFRNGYPFCSLDSPDKQELSFQHVIRNDIAHRSNASQDRFRDMCVGRGINLPSRELAVRRYLQTPFSLDVTRFENHVSQQISIAKKLER
jgi:hypothetical protein